MLVLTRRCGESLVIGENGEIRVTFLATKGKQVRIGIEAPPNINVDREEIFLKKQDTKKAKENEIRERMLEEQAKRLEEKGLAESEEA